MQNLNDILFWSIQENFEKGFKNCLGRERKLQILNHHCFIRGLFCLLTSLSSCCSLLKHKSKHCENKTFMHSKGKEMKMEKYAFVDTQRNISNQESAEMLR